MAVQDFYNRNAPYVHSNILNFRSVAAVNLASIDLTQAEKKLEELEKRLKAEADNFWGGETDYRKVSQDVFNSDQSFGRLALLIIESNQMVEIIQRATVIDFGPDTAYSNLLNDYAKKYNLDVLQTMTTSDQWEEFANYITNMVFNDKSFVSVNAEIETRKTSTKNIDKELMQMYRKFAEDKDSGGYGRKYFRSSNSFKKFTKKYFRSQTEIKYDYIWNEFKTIFEVRAKELPHLQGDIEQYLNQLKSPFINALKGAVDLYSKENIIDAISSNLTTTIINNDNTIQFKLVNVGQFNDQEVQKKLKNFVTSEKQVIGSLSYKGTDKTESPSDFLLCYGDKVVRVQSKNSLTLFEQVKDSFETSKIPQALKLQDQIKYLTFLDKISTYQDNVDIDYDQLSYLVANVLWFRNHQTQERVYATRGPANTETKTEGINAAMRTINRILSQEIAYLLGVAEEEFANSVNDVIGGSNTFYIIDNKVILPSYLIVHSMREQLNKVEDRLSTIQATIKLKSFGANAVTFENEKKAARLQDGEYKGGWNYGPTVLNVGQNMGRDIISNTIIDRINLQVRLQKLFEGIQIKY